MGSSPIFFLLLVTYLTGSVAVYCSFCQDQPKLRFGFLTAKHSANVCKNPSNTQREFDQLIVYST